MTQKTSEKASQLEGLSGPVPGEYLVPVGNPGVVSYKATVNDLLGEVKAEKYGFHASLTATENTAAMARALAATGAGGVVSITVPGTYEVTTIALSGGRSVRGAPGVTIKWGAAAVSPLVTVTGSGCGLYSLSFDGNASFQSGSVVAVTLTTAPKFRLEHCDVSNFQYKFLLTDEGGELSPDGAVIDCKFINCGTTTNCDVLGIRCSRWYVGGGTQFDTIGDGHCIRLGLYTNNVALGPVMDTRIIGVGFANTQHVGVTCELFTRGAVIDGCIFRNLEQGVKTEIQDKTVYDISVTNCQFYTLTGTDSVNLSAPRCTFSNNRCYDWAGSLTLNSYAKVHGNYFSNCGSLANTQPTIQVITAGGFAAEGDFSIQHNDIYNAPYRGISCTVGGLKASRNVITSCADRAINTGGGNNDISGNKIDGATIGIVMSSTFTTSRVRGNQLLNCSTSQVSFTNNTAFRSVVMNDNGLSSGDYNEVIATGAITVGLSEQSIILDTEGGAATDDLDTIAPVTGIVPGHRLVIRSNANARDPVIKHNTGNIILVGGVDFTLATTASKIALMWSGTKWQELWRATA